MPEAKGVEAVERALSLLDCFEQDSPALSLAELSQRSGLYKSTILRMIVSLSRFAYIERGADDLYRLGPSTWRLGSVFSHEFALADVLRPELVRLSTQCRETASFYVRAGERRVCLYRSEPVRSIRHSLAEGVMLPLGIGASGRILQAYSENQDDTAQLRQQGYAVSLGERDPEVAAVAVPLWMASGEFVGALALSGLINRFDEAQQQALLAALLESQERLSSVKMKMPRAG